MESTAPRGTSQPDAAVLPLAAAHNAPELGSRPTTLVRAAVNASSVELQIAGRPPQRGGGKRDRCRGQSKQSRRRLIRRLASIDQHQYPADRILFVTLTYHRTWPADPAGWRAHIDAWKKRIERKHGEIPAVWVKEFQTRGAPHFHLVMFCPTNPLQELEEKRHSLIYTMWRAWCDIAGYGSEWHRRYGFTCSPARSWRGVMSYASKYISKDDQHEYRSDQGELLPTGRMWGVWREQLLPISFESTTISFKHYLMLRRWFRRLSRPQRGRQRLRKHRGALTNQHVLLTHGELNRLLSWLGYYAL